MIIVKLNKIVVLNALVTTTYHIDLRFVSKLNFDAFSVR